MIELPEHTGKRHQLGISNGWSGDGNSAISVWCGYCKAEFRPDHDWAERVMTAKAKRLTPLLTKSEYGLNQAQYEKIMAETRSQFVRAGLLVREEVDHGR